MLRTSLAVLAATLLAGAAQAAPVPALTGSNIVIKVVDDATSETDAIQLDENKEPYKPGSGMKQKSPQAGSSSGSGDLEIQEFDRETNQ